MTNGTALPSDQNKHENDKEAKGKKAEIHLIDKAIARGLNSFADIEDALTYIPESIAAKKVRDEKIKKKMVDAKPLLQSNNSAEQVHGIRMALEAYREMERSRGSNVAAVMERSLFISLFSVFDTFSSDLIRAIFHLRPELFNSIDTQVEFAQILLLNSVEPIKQKILEDEIESIRREAYTVQFKKLEKMFGISTLRDFPEWPRFIEAGQRRNLMVHCDGIVSAQYIAVCKEYRIDIGTATVGTQLILGKAYFLGVIQLLIKVIVMLGHTLWRKLLNSPEQKAKSQDVLNETIYRALLAEDWNLGFELGQFAIDRLERDSQEVGKLICQVNYAIALKFGGKLEKVSTFLNNQDWGGALWDFQIAHKVLLDQFDKAATLMKKMGPNGSIIAQVSYHTWPLFNAFRESAEFQQAYEEIYGHPFVVDMKNELKKDFGTD